MASDYLDGALPRRTRFGIRLHLLMCWMCRLYVHQLTLTSRVLRSLAGGREPVEPPAPVRDVFRAWKAERDNPSNPKAR